MTMRRGRAIAAGGMVITMGLLSACVVFFRDSLLQEFWYPKLPPHIERVLWWLPEDTQTLIVSQGPFAIAGPRGHVSNHDMRQMLPGISLGILFEAKNGAIGELIAGRKVSLWLEGSKEFRSPRGLGLMPFKGCGIVVLEEDLGEDGTGIMASLESKAKETLAIGQHRVFLFQTTMEQDLWSFYIVSPVSNVLVVATDMEYLETVLRRRVERGTRRALPPHLPEWRHLDMDANSWAVRHYDRSDAGLDTSSPLMKFNTLALSDQGAIGVVFQMGRGGHETPVVHYLSTSPEVSQIMSGFWTKAEASLGLTPSVRQVRPGVAEVQFAPWSANDSSRLLFILLWLLGHGVYV